MVLQCPADLEISRLAIRHDLFHALLGGVDGIRLVLDFALGGREIIQSNMTTTTTTNTTITTTNITITTTTNTIATTTTTTTTTTIDYYY